LSFAQAGTIFVSSESGGSIFALDSTTGAVSATIATGLSSPTQLALDASGNLYFAESGNGNIDRYNIASGTLTLSWINTSAASVPFGLAFDAAGNLYVSEEDGEVAGYSSSGAPEDSFSISGTPRGLTYVTAGSLAGTLLLAQTGPDLVDSLTTSSGVTALVPSAGLDGPRYAVVDSTGTLMDVSDAYNGTVESYAISGSTVSSGATAISGLGAPEGLLLLGGSLYVADYSGNDVTKCTGGTCTSFAVGIQGPNDIVYTSASAVPEPATCALILAGIAAIALKRRLVEPSLWCG